ncbi:hypothetical protein GCM10009801_63550 [Streptomyces albiaxialis]|uniref:Uncharacterized protein n=1 Tax=Streptomyces albiaxialis TaxID=329523 RepID=A0ABN2WMG2_9ACTN
MVGEELAAGLRAVEEFENVEYVLEHCGSLVRVVRACGASVRCIRAVACEWCIRAVRACGACVVHASCVSRRFSLPFP